MICSFGAGLESPLGGGGEKTTILVGEGTMAAIAANVVPALMAAVETELEVEMVVELIFL
jgi:hypothetical protein